MHLFEFHLFISFALSLEMVLINSEMAKRQSGGVKPQDN